MAKMPDTARPYFAPKEVAQMLMVSAATIRLWASKGDLPSVTTPGGHRRFLPHEIERFARERNLTLHLPHDDELRILIVDDSPQVTTYLARRFATEASTVTMAANDGFTAGRLVQQFNPHVVLLDLMMPGLNGFDVCAQIKSDPAHKAVRIIAMTGYYTPENEQRALSAGAELCIAKPIDTSELFRSVGLRPINA